MNPSRSASDITLISASVVLSRASRRAALYWPLGRRTDVYGAYSYMVDNKIKLIWMVLMEFIISNVKSFIFTFNCFGRKQQKLLFFFILSLSSFLLSRIFTFEGSERQIFRRYLNKIADLLKPWPFIKKLLHFTCEYRLLRTLRRWSILGSLNNYILVMVSCN
jgi:hypothetical protein